MQAAHNRIKIYQKSQLPHLEKLDVNKLGRPYHKIPKIMNNCFDVLDAKLSIYFLKKYRVNVSLKNMSFKMDHHYKHAQIFSTQYGNIGFDIDRILLLSILHDYYGLSRDNKNNVPDTTQPSTKTEERLKNKLGTELTHLAMNPQLFGETLEIKNDHAAIINQWSYSIHFQLEGYDNGGFTLLLDNRHVDRLLALLRHPSGEEQPAHETVTPEQIERMFYSLPLTLYGRLVSINLTVAHLLEIKAGDLLPISLNERLPVGIGKEQMFSAIIAEERGKLFLSEFNDKSNEISHD